MSNRLTRTYAGSESSPDQDTRYVYDALGRMDAVEVYAEGGQGVSPAEATDYVYDLLGNLDELHSTNGAIADYEYDELNRLELLRHYTDYNTGGSYEAGVDTLLAEFDYDLRADGKRIGVSEIDDQGNSTRIDWSYDDIGRLVRESYNSHDDSLDFIADYIFDLTGNRIEKQTDTDPTFSGTPTFDESIDYGYDANDRLLAETKDAPGTSDDRHTVYEYGPNADVANGYGGDHTTRTGKTEYQGLDSSGSPLSGLRFEYDLQNRLSQSEVDANGDGTIDSTITYEYDANGMRVAKTEDGQTLFYLVDGNNPTGHQQVLAEYNAAQQLQRTFTLGLDILRQAEPTGLTHHFLYDGHGSTRALISAAASVVSGQRFGYDAYGLAIGYDPAAALTTHQYSGEQYDAKIGYGYNRLRYYDLATGTWNRVDPYFGKLSDPQSLHKTLYVHGNPVMMTDPTGQFGLGFGLGLVMGLIGNFSKSSKDVSTGSAAGGTATILGFQANVKTAIALSLVGITALAPVLNPSGNILETGPEYQHRVWSARRALHDLRWGFDPDLADDIEEDEKLSRKKAEQLNLIEPWQTNNDEVPVFIEYIATGVSPLAGVALADFKALMAGYTPVLNFHNGGTGVTSRNRNAAQAPWKKANPPGLIPTGQSLEEYPFASTPQGGLQAYVELVNDTGPGVTSYQSRQGGLLQAFKDRHPELYNPFNPFIVVVLP